jgi:hypothetical protein
MSTAASLPHEPEGRYPVRYIQYYTPRLPARARRGRTAGRCYDRTCGAPDCACCYPGGGGEETTEEGE